MGGRRTLCRQRGGLTLTLTLTLTLILTLTLTLTLTKRREAAERERDCSLRLCLEYGIEWCPAAQGSRVFARLARDAGTPRATPAPNPNPSPYP